MYKKLIRPRLFKTDPEEAHDRVSRNLSRLGKMPFLPSLIRKFTAVNDPLLQEKHFGITFDNPIGLAAGMDKTGSSILGWQALGFGFIEIGAVLPEQQSGNEKPRMFRLPEDDALINRMGFNSPGVGEVIQNLEKYSPYLSIPLGINIGKNKHTSLERAANDYATVARALTRFADFYVVNVSSPNTPGLRSLQDKDALEKILVAVKRVSYYIPKGPGIPEPIPVLVKVAPDLTKEATAELIEVCKETEIDGIVATNTTTSREGLTRDPGEVGGLSGKPLKPKALEMVRTIRKLAPELPIIGVGGIYTAEDAIDFLNAGADLLQVFSGLVYEGPLLVRNLNKALLETTFEARLLEEEEFSFKTP